MNLNPDGRGDATEAAWLGIREFRVYKSLTVTIRSPRLFAALVSIERITSVHARFATRFLMSDYFHLVGRLRPTDGFEGLHRYLERFICPSKQSKRVAFTRANCLKRDVFFRGRCSLFQQGEAEIAFNESEENTARRSRVLIATLTRCARVFFIGRRVDCN